MVRNLTRTTVSKAWRQLVAASVIASGFTAVDARAAVLLDTFAPGDTAIGLPLGLSRNPQGVGTSLAVSFSTASAVSVDSILAAISGTGNVSLGIMSDASGLPSDTFLHSVVLSNPTANVSLTNLGWSLNPGSYWLAAVGDPGFIGSWTQGTFSAGPTWASKADFSAVPGWEVFGPLASPAARITTAIPEPETYAMLLAGLGLVGVVMRRRTGERAV